MKFEITRNSIRITPQNDQDTAFIEDTLGLNKAGDSIPLVRVSPMGFQHSIAYLESKRIQREEI